jgi:hypothetical protein
MTGPMNRTRLHLVLAGALLAVASASLTPASLAAQTRPAPTMTGTGPNGATMRCRDGSHPPANSPASACDSKGGLAYRYPMRAQPNPVGSTAASPAAAPSASRPAAQTETPAPKSWSERVAETRAANLASLPPRDATLLCSDGTFVVRDTSAARCAAHGGLKARIAPQAPAVQLRPAPNP